MFDVCGSYLVKSAMPQLTSLLSDAPPSMPELEPARNMENLNHLNLLQLLGNVVKDGIRPKNDLSHDFLKPWPRPARRSSGRSVPTAFNWAPPKAPALGLHTEDIKFPVRERPHSPIT